MLYRDYNFDLAERFRKDYGMPISIVKDPECFFYEVAMYENLYGSETKWKEIVDLINNHFDGKPDSLLQAVAGIRRQMVDNLLATEAVQEFIKNNESYIDAKKKVSYPHALWKSLYNEEASGKIFVSVDMKKANFQCLKKIGAIPDVTYEEYVKQYCSDNLFKYISESKQFRQSVFGNCDSKNMPNRMIAYQKYLMYNIYLERIKPLYEELEIAYFSADEIVFLLPKGKDGHVVETHLARLIKDDGDFRVTLFYLQGYALYAKHRDGSEHKVCTFFQKSSDEPGKYKGGSALYNKIIYRLLRGEKITENDRMFINNDCMAEFKDEFYIKEI